MYQRIICIISVLIVAQNVQAQKTKYCKLANTIQSGMVIQQSAPFTVWGTARAGSTIKVKAGWNNKTFTVKNGWNNTWEVKIDVPAATPGKFTPYELDIYADNDTIKITDILIGDVWLCSGQSNMDMELKPFLPWLKGVIDYETEIAAANYPQIRLLDIKSDFQKIPVEDCKGTWKTCTPDNAKDFSAVAYYFGRELYKRLNIPVGLVTSSIGATTCQAWTSRETLEGDKVLSKILYRYDTSAAAKETLDSTVTFEKLTRPTLLYNAMIYPLRRFSLKGFLWYQGESNKDDAAIYARLNTAMIKNWRFLFQQGDLPFYFVQVAPYNWQENDSTKYNYAVFRDAQKDVLKLKNTGMVVTMDIGEADDIHPRNKKDVGVRLALHALAKTYKQSNIQYEGPVFNNFSISGNTVKVSFEKNSTGSGLATNDNQPPRHFYIAGSDKVFHYANATIVKNEVWLTCDKVQRPVAVRYAYTNYPITNFGNKEGLPCVPFRTDSW